MTPERLTGLAALLLELRDWIAATYDGTLDLELVDACVDVCALYRNLLVQELAK